MAMTIGEANAVQRILDHLVGNRPVALDELTHHASILADRSSKVLMAGLSGDQVTQAFGKGDHPGVIPDAEIVEGYLRCARCLTRLAVPEDGDTLDGLVRVVRSHLQGEGCPS
jgi:uncharacterized metal-binding protein YceD (DUF177 family)